MHKSLGHLAAFGTVFFINSAYARSGASECPQVMSIPALKEIIKAKLHSKVTWANTSWTLVLNPFASGELPFNVTTTQLRNARNNNGTLECYYEFVGSGYSLLELTTSYTGPV
jgi:hypothetical protein